MAIVDYAYDDAGRMTTATLPSSTCLGSTMAVVDASGVVQDSYTYDVYGTPPKTGSLANEFDFAGQQTGSGGIWSWMAWALDDGGRFVVGRCTTAPAFGQHCSPISSPFGPKNAYYER